MGTTGITRTSRRIRDSDLRAMLRLAGEAGELPADSDARRHHLLAGVCRLVGATAATAFILGRDLPRGGRLMDPGGPFLSAGLGPAQAAAVLAYVRDGTPRLSDPVCPRLLWRTEPLLTQHRRQLAVEDAWYRSAFFEGFRAPLGLDDTLYARLPVPGGGTFSVAVYRQPGDRPFTDRDCQLIDLFHADAGRLYGPCADRAAGGEPSAGDDPSGDPPAGTRDVAAALPPRLRPVLDCLLRGDAEKQAAAALGLSRHTVHEYVKVLYRKLGVSSRGELLARFVQPAAAAGLGTGGRAGRRPRCPVRTFPPADEATRRWGGT